MKNVRTISDLTINLKNNRPVDWYNWRAKHLISICNFYIEIGWCKKYNNYLEQFEEFQLAVSKVDDNRERIIRSILDRSPGLREYLMIHSVFDIDDNNSGDWLVKLMINKLVPTDEEVARAHKLDCIPDEIMEKLSVFDPKPFGFEKNLDETIIRYKMYGNWRKGESTDPITVIDRGWENVGRKVSLKTLRNIIASYKPVSIN